jgi:protein-S-isoprenylcysteine O-methyltransferase Ste14
MTDPSPTPQAFDVRKGDQSMITGWVGAILAVVGPLVISQFTNPLSRALHNVVHFWWLVGLMVGLAVLDHVLHRRQHGLGPAVTPLPWPRLLRAALVRWVSWLGILLLAWTGYHALNEYSHRFYKTFRTVLLYVIQGWLVLGLPYLLISLRRRHGLRWDFHDPSVLMALLARRLFRAIDRGTSPLAALSLAWRSSRARLVLGGVVVKAFFLPLMFTYFLGNTRDMLRHWRTLMLRLAAEDAWGVALYDTAEALYNFSFNTLFAIDVTLTVIGYALTVRWLNNGIKSVERTALGWAICLACYKPLNTVTGWYFLWPDDKLAKLADGPLKLAVMAAVIALLLVYVWATMSFGLRFSNLTNRGVFTQGPYRFLRHPAYVSKNLAWWAQYIPSFTDPVTALYMLCWNGIYLVRALTEERHLKLDPKYRAYCEYVKWRFIPGLF